ncbi:SDR family NAD(P)-dependent oxidoreductase [Deinococcus altitudinis]|uniref:SDR family NAD(P)-dependent oxidoreductase n=1 Tax=Deinococcus altitudinis TaxID=468914 RepID=UPI00389176C0
MATLHGKVVYITGASRGIGAVTARSLIEAGASVVAHLGRSSREDDPLLQAFGPDRVYTLHGDLAVPGEAARLFQAAIDWKGRVDVLVNNAGISPSLPLDAPLDEWSRVWTETLQVNLMSVAEGCRAALLHYGERGGGTIINIASRSAFRGDSPDAMHCAASKAGVVALTKSIARGFAGRGVLTYAVAPGWVQTEMAEAYLAAHAEELARELPMGVAAPAEDVANTVVFLASGAVPHMTGATLDINGASYVR